MHTHTAHTGKMKQIDVLTLQTDSFRFRFDWNNSYAHCPFLHALRVRTESFSIYNFESSVFFFFGSLSFWSIHKRIHILFVLKRILGTAQWMNERWMSVKIAFVCAQASTVPTRTQPSGPDKKELSAHAYTDENSSKVPQRLKCYWKRVLSNLLECTQNQMRQLCTIIFSPIRTEWKRKMKEDKNIQQTVEYTLFSSFAEIFTNGKKNCKHSKHVQRMRRVSVC